MPPTVDSHGAPSTAQLYREHAAFLLRFLLRRGFSCASAEDLVHEIFITADHIGGYQPGPATARTWLCSIALRLGANARRREKKQRKLLMEVIHNSSTRDTRALGPEAMLWQRRNSERIESVLALLSPKQQEYLVSFHLVGHSCEEIAKRDNIPIGTVYSRLHAARNLFIEAYRR